MEMPAKNAKLTSLRHGTLLVTVLSLLPHIFCCGIPVVAALIGLGTTVGLSTALAASPFYHMVDAYHTELLMLAIGGVTLSGLLNLIAYRLDCRQAACTHGSCSYADCKPRKMKSFRIFFISLALLALDLAWFATEEHILGLHHHSGHHQEDQHQMHHQH